MMIRFSEIYPTAVYPKVYIVLGMINSNGTQTELGLFIAAEMFVKSEKMPIENFTEWQKNTISPPELIVLVTFHELMHFSTVLS